jgi:hypothetical protein
MERYEFQPSGKKLKDRIERGGIQDQYFQSKEKGTSVTRVYKVIQIQDSRLDFLVSYVNHDGIDIGSTGYPDQFDILSHQWDSHLIKVER